MHRHTRRTVITTLLASSFALSGVVALAPSAGAAVPTASCTVTPNASGTSVTIKGEGFTAPRKLNDGESTEPLNVDANGNFQVTRFQKNVDYTVLAVNEDQNFTFVNCKVVKSNDSTGTNNPTNNPSNNMKDKGRGYGDGYRAGRSAAQKSCDDHPTPNKNQQHSDAYWKAWQQGADSAFNKVCGSGNSG
ncbi:MULTISPECIES: hypothetical protein [unclassified Streptomyces]|uniref:hypothetical protein n=1 Tax=unclassified Streptomyces TaxID=2593676 RepID=UPI00109EDFD7|nr:hypothetical protein [Streptomyces sp. A1136]THA52871.1 hypothetical protein E6R62_19565 [Streptomyces sp. A1136]